MSPTEENGDRVTGIIPAPATLEVHADATTFRLTEASRLVARGPGASEVAETLGRVLRAATGFRLPVVAGAGDADAAASDIALLVRGGPRLQTEAEGYALECGTRGVRIEAAEAAGLFWGTQTLQQLLPAEIRRAAPGAPPPGGWTAPAVSVADAPRFAYRGAMLDVARHFFPVDDVLDFIDRIALLKLNVLHLHLTDDQGWRIQIDSWPLLTERAASSDASGGAGGFFTKADFGQIVDYAAERHITIVPEIDLPGHTHAVGVAYSDLVEEPWLTEASIDEAKRLGQPTPEHGEPYAGWGVGHSSLRLHDERIYGFVTDVLTEVAAMTPGPYLHIGGDECLGTSPDDFAAFFERATRIAAETGKTPVAWHEAGAVQNLAEGTIGQYWGSVEPHGSHAEHATHFVVRGGRLIMSPSDRTYLDIKPSADFPLGLAWAGIVPLQVAYDWDPADVVGVPEDAILGVEAPLWTETVETLEQADTLLYPRLFAHAETAWSPREGAERTWESFRARLDALDSDRG